MADSRPLHQQHGAGHFNLEFQPPSAVGGRGKYYVEPPSRVAESRQCTDCLFVLVFLVAYAALALLGYQVVRAGDIDIFENFAFGKNYKGERCGVDHNVKDFPLIYYTVQAHTPAKITSDPKLLVPMLSGVCTSSCPSQRGNGQAVESYDLTDPSTCSDEARRAGLCTWYGVQVTQIANYCLDANLYTLGNQMTLDTFVVDLRSSVGFIAVSFVFSLLVGFLWLLLIRLCARTFIWLTLLGSIGTLTCGGVYLFTNASQVADQVHVLDENSVRYVAYACWVAGALLLLTVACSVKSIAIAASILKSAAVFLADVKSMMFTPILSALLQLFTLVTFSMLLANAASVGIKVVQGQPQTGTCMYEDGLLNPFCVQFDRSSTVTYSLLFIAFMYFWSAALVHAFDTFSVAYAAGVWYFSPYHGPTHKRLPGDTMICRGLTLSLRGFCAGLKQIGSLAMGSLIMAICRLLVVLCKWAKRKEGAVNPVMKCICAIVTCVALCLDRTARLVTDNAYIQMALSGEGFCKSCFIGLGVVVRNPVLASCVSGCSWLFSLVGPIAVMSLSGSVCSFFLLRNDLPPWLIAQPLKSITAPMSAVLLLALIIGLLMMKPYAVVSQTIMHAFAADREADKHAHNGVAPNVDGYGFKDHTPKPLQGFVRDYCPDDHVRFRG